MDDRRMARADAQFVTLGIEREVFAVPVEAVVEIIAMRPVFRIPDGPSYLAGLIDVRGRGVPVIDLRVKLGLSATTATEMTRILVLEVELAGRRIVLGLIADRVFEVMSIDLGHLEAAPDIGVTWRSDYIEGVGRRGDGFVVIFNLPKFFSTDAVALQGSRGAANGAAMNDVATNGAVPNGAVPNDAVPNDAVQGTAGQRDMPARNAA